MADGLSAQAPDDDWRTLRTDHFRVTFPESLEPLGRRAAERAERAWSELETHFIEPPDGVIDLLLTDHTDRSNGYAQVTPSNRITIFARPPTDEMSIGFTDEWLELVITHELAHIVHLDYTANPIGRLARSVFGRVTLDWPFFPELGTPRWVVEGLATWYESSLTDAGRVRGTFLEMQLRTAALEGRFENIGQASGDSPLWPGGNRAYAYGSLFFAHLLRQYGEESLVDFVEAVGGQWVPYRIDAAGRHAFGVSLTDAWRAWGDSLRTEVADLDARLARFGPVTEPERLTREARWALWPRVSPDGSLLAYARSDGTSDIQLRLMDMETGESRSAGRTNALATFDWSPDGDLVMSQLEFRGPYRTYGDLYRVTTGGSTTRVTRGARLDQPDVAPDGGRAVAVRQGDGTAELVTVDLASGEVATLVPSDPDVQWAYPRWSPDGRWIAATRWEPGAFHDVVILDGATGRVADRVTRDRALDLAPSWSPDGRWVVWASDRTGTMNILAASVDPASGDAAAPLLLTNVRTGAAFPSVDPAGEWVYFSGYHVDGWEIERVPFEPEGAQPAPAPDQRFAATITQPRRGAAEGEVGGYSPLPTLGPRYWEISYSNPVEAPSVTREGVFLRRREILGFGLGIRTSGRDLVGRHAWTAEGRVTTGKAKFEGGLSYRYAGLGNPILTVGGSQRFQDGGQFLAEPELDTLIVLERRRSVTGALTVLAPRWRRNLSFTGSAGLSWERRQVLDERLDVSTDYTLTRPTSRFADFGLSANFNSSRSHAFQMGAARGVSLFLYGGVSRQLALPDSLVRVIGADQSFEELRGQLRGALPLWKVGYARHVLAFQASAGLAAGPGAGPGQYRVGGASGRLEDLTGLELFGGSFLFFPVRGYPTSSRFGNRAWTASAEYRFPLWMINRGFRAWPVFLNRMMGSVFFDVGNAWGPAVWRDGIRNPRQRELAAAGAEVTADVLGLFDVPLRLRLGFGVPLVRISGVSGGQLWLRVGLPY